MELVAGDIASQLLQIKAIKLSPQKPFTWTSGLLSPIYCDNRLTLSYPAVRHTIRDGLANLVREFGFVDVIAGVATAGIPHGALVAEKMDLPFIYVRSKAKEHGKKNQIEGRVIEGQKVIVVEDLISTGKSSINACRALTEAGLEVVGLVSIFNYDLDVSRNNFESEGVRYKSLTNYDKLLQIAEKENYVTPEEIKSLREWRESPQNWSDNRK